MPHMPSFFFKTHRGRSRWLVGPEEARRATPVGIPPHENKGHADEGPPHDLLERSFLVGSADS